MALPLVWIFEDDPDHCDLIAVFCGMAGVTFTARIFRGSQDIDALLRSPPAPPCAAIVDSNLIGLDGFSVIQRLRAAYGLDLPVIFYSSTPLSLEREAAAQAGANAVLIKDFGRDGLPEALARLAKINTGGAA